MKTHRLIGLCGFIVLAALLVPAAESDLGRPGQSRTLLPDGQVLYLGGLDQQEHPLASAFLVNSSRTEKLGTGLQVARAGHTATVLPDGTVLVFGGVGANGQIVSTAELFDPAAQQFSVLTDVLAIPRAFHTATLLLDGTVLLAGGIEAGGQFPDDVQFWDFRTHAALSQHALMMVPRQGHTAVLLADGSVRISGGTDRFGRPVLIDEIFDSTTKQFRFANQAEMGEAQDGDADALDANDGLQIADSIPEDGATNVSIRSMVAFRFTRLLKVTTINAANFTLVGPDGNFVTAKVVGAENGRLAFVTLAAPLHTGTTYVLRIENATDNQNNPLGPVSISFTTEGEPSAGPDAEDAPGVTPTTQFQQLPPLQALRGETALAGQVLKLNGWPLERVTLQMDGKEAKTDETGRFLLRGLTAGHHVLWIDSSTANRAGATYGTYEVGVTISAGKTTVLNYTIWQAKLDTVHVVHLPSPTREETIITNPNLPGLELHIPAGTTITDRYGKVVHDVGMTAIPLPQPPFPLPAGVEVPIYFTVQPGGAYLKVQYTGKGPKGAQLFYPNAFHLGPGSPFNFWNYDANVKGWYIYGHGVISSDGQRAVPDPDIAIYEFTGAMGSGTGSSGQADNSGQPVLRSDPVSMATGQFVYTKTDLALPDVIPINFSRTYISNDSFTRPFGVAFTDSYDMFLIADINPYTFQELILNDGARIRFDRISPGTSYVGSVYVHASAQDAFYGAQLIWNGNATSGNWKLTMKDGTVYIFPEASQSTNPLCQAPLSITDRYNNTVQLQRAPSGGGPPPGCQLEKIVSPNGRYISLTHNSQGLISQAQDNSGRTVSYTYDSAGRLSTVTDVGGGVTTYTYSDQNQMLTIQDARGIVYLTNQFDSSGRVVQQTEADGGVYQFKWTPTGNTSQDHFYARSAGLAGGGGEGGGKLITDAGCWGPNGFARSDATCQEGYLPLVAQVDVTDPRGYVEQIMFGPTGYMTSDTHALGQPEQQTVTYQYYSDNLLQSATDALSRTTAFNYDADGHPISVTRLSGTSNAVTSTAAFNGPFGQISTMSDPLGHTSSFSYDQFGNLVAASDALGHQTTFTYNGDGRLATATDALSNTVQFSYFGPDLASVTDPLGNVSTQSADAVGRAIATTDALGSTTKYQYNNLNLLVQTTDELGNSTSFSYDGNGNLLTLTDALSHTTSYAYDSMERVLIRTDPLLHQESYSYDPNGNLASSTDRKNQVTTFTYDGLNRLKFVGFNTSGASYESTISYTYDAGNRMTQAVDSPGGTITDAYDNLDRLTSETTAQGSISYGYDAADRETSMQVAGQSVVNYTYDNANRVTQIAQSSSATSFSYDNGNRRTSLTLPNGVVVSYSYDNDSRPTGITYTFGSSTMGNLSYAYDQLGRRTQVGGTFARTGLPGAVSSATYDGANELTHWSGIALSYDANGSMLSDGSNNFTWNARGQVASLNNVSLQYDAFGRRIRNLAGTSFLYDGDNAIQELSATTVTANLLSGGIDEVFSRTDSSGSFTPLKDALGSTVALVDSGGNIQTSYTYDPFGNTSIAGAANANEFQYTGRENDGSGLYYLRARYYSPLLHRFISQDPAGFLADINFYRYCFDSPTGCSDRFGLLGGGSEGGPEEDSETYVPRPNTNPEDGAARETLGDDVIDTFNRARENEQEDEAAAEAAARARDPLANVSPEEQMAIERGACPVNPEVGRAIALRQIFNRLYRAGGRNLGNFRLRPGETMISARTTLSNPWPLAPGQRPVFRLGDDYVEIDPAKLPGDSFTIDVEPDGHVSITAAPEVIQNAVVARGRLPK